MKSAANWRGDRLHSTRTQLSSGVAFGSCWLLLLVALPAAAGERTPGSSAHLRVAFSSLRPLPYFGTIYFYEHDGVSRGRIVGSIPPKLDTGDYRPSLSADGRLCAYTSRTGEGNTWVIQLWDWQAGKAVEVSGVNEAGAAHKDPSISADGNLLLYAGLRKKGGTGGWDGFLFDRKLGASVAVPNLNSRDDEQDFALSGNGRYIAFASSRPGGKGLSDVYLYDRQTQALVPLPALNSSYRELSPALSQDGRFIAFVSDRPGGDGGKDVYLYDRRTSSLVALPGLNSVGHEQTPSLSPDGRFVAFVSERTRGVGERDIYLYDRHISKLLPTPGLNSKADDFDPSLAFVK
jgi:Tol biopolymer transport system component